VEADYLHQVIQLLQPRVTLLGDFKTQSSYFFASPTELDTKALKKKYKPENEHHFLQIHDLLSTPSNSAEEVSQRIKSYITDQGAKFGEIFTVLRVWLVGEMSGPDLFELIQLIGHEEAQDRIKRGLDIAKALD